MLTLIAQSSFYLQNCSALSSLPSTTDIHSFTSRLVSIALYKLYFFSSVLSRPTGPPVRPPLHLTTMFGEMLDRLSTMLDNPTFTFFKLIETCFRTKTGQTYPLFSVFDKMLCEMSGLLNTSLNIAGSAHGYIQKVEMLSAMLWGVLDRLKGAFNLEQFQFMLSIDSRNWLIAIR